MMRSLPLIALSLALAACTTTRPAMPAGPDLRPWLAGTWLLLEEDGDRSLVACNSGLPIAYAPDGTYSLFEESGRWSLSGDRLTETATEASDGTDPADVAIGRPFVSRIERVGPNEMRKTLHDGTVMTLLRCPG